MSAHEVHLEILALSIFSGLFVNLFVAAAAFAVADAKRKLGLMDWMDRCSPRLIKWGALWMYTFWPVTLFVAWVLHKRTGAHH